MDLGIADAGTLCREGEIPSSKIHRAMERLVELALAQIQLAENLATGFERLWRKAMRGLREIDFHPGVGAAKTTRNPSGDRSVRRGSGR